MLSGKKLFLLVVGLLISVNRLYAEIDIKIPEQIWAREVIIKMEYLRVDPTDTLKKEERFKMGNGVLISGDLVLTASHILKIEDGMLNPEITIFIWLTKEEIKIDFADIYFSEDKDMAFIHLKNVLPIEPVVIPKNQLNWTEKVYSATVLLDNNFNLFPLILSYRVASFLKDGYILDRVGPQGMSGSGIYNKKAELVGLAISVKYLGNAPFLMAYNAEAIREAHQELIDKNPFKQGEK